MRHNRNRGVKLRQNIMRPYNFLRKPIEILLKNVYCIPIKNCIPIKKKIKKIKNSWCKDLTVQSKSHRNQISQTG